MGMVEISKKAAIDVISSLKITEVHIGTVVSNNIDIKIEQKLTLPRSFFIIPRRLTKEELLEYGDKVILLRVQGGQQYVVLDKVG